MSLLSELAGKGWTLVEPPERDDADSVVGRYKGEPVRAGFRLETVEDSDEEIHCRYRSGRYDLDVKLDLVSGHGQVRVQEADGYGN